MRTHLVFLAACLLVGFNTPAARAQSTPDSTQPDYYVGAGVRAGLNDSFAGVLDAKAKITNLGDLTLSARPAVMIGNQVELRLPLTVEGRAMDRVYPYGGAGLAYNTDGLNAVDPMLAAGVDVVVGRNLVLDLNFNVIFQTAISDTDAELAVTLNYVF